VGLAFAPDWVGPYVWSAEGPSERIFEAGTVVNCESDFYLPMASGLSLQIDTIIFDRDSAELTHAIKPQLIVV
jgi:hypothetical protein